MITKDYPSWRESIDKLRKQHFDIVQDCKAGKILSNLEMRQFAEIKEDIEYLSNLLKN